MQQMIIAHYPETNRRGDFWLKNKKTRIPIVRYQGLYEEESPNSNAEYLFSELLETRSGTFDWKIGPHIHAVIFQVFFIEKGSFKFYESNQEHLHQGPCILIIPPAALHGFIDRTLRIERPTAFPI